MGFAGNQVALLHQGGERCSDRNHAGHGDPHKQVGPHKQLAVVEVGDGHAPKGADHHDRQQNAADLEVALGELPLDQLLAGLGIRRAGALGLDAQEHAVAGES